MLQSIHDKLKGWVAGVVLGAIGLVFVFWGINRTLSAPTYAAKVNGTEISANEVRQAYQQQLAQIQRQSNVPLDDAMRNEIKQRVLDRIRGERGIGHARRRFGLSSQRFAVARRKWRRCPLCKWTENSTTAHALAVLNAQGRSPAEIEELFRHDAKLQQLDRALSASSFATPPK